MSQRISFNTAPDAPPLYCTICDAFTPHELLQGEPVCDDYRSH